MPDEVTKKIIVLGITGSGKSSICNLITRTNAFATSNAACSVTQSAQQEAITENGVKYEVAILFHIFNLSEQRWWILLDC